MYKKTDFPTFKNLPEIIIEWEGQNLVPMIIISNYNFGHVLEGREIDLKKMQIPS